MRRRCTKCRVKKHLETEFSVHAAGKNGYRRQCKQCVSEYQRDYQRSYRERRTKGERERLREYKRKKAFLYNLRRLYGITVEEYEDLRRAQGDKCAVCGDAFLSDTPHVDHCHRTGRVRGLLCGPCNRALGIMKDSINLLKSAIRYLRANGEKD
jgi:hypothetical protein